MVHNKKFPPRPSDKPITYSSNDLIGIQQETGMKFWIKIQFVKFWCWLTNGEAVFVKIFNDHSTYILYIKVARRQFDPFNNSPPLSVMFNTKNKIGNVILDDDGKIAGYKSNIWTYANLGKRTEHCLKQPV